MTQARVLEILMEWSVLAITMGYEVIVASFGVTKSYKQVSVFCGMRKAELDLQALFR